MPAGLRVDGLRFVVYPNDYPPAHVHVIGPDWEAVINLTGNELREVYSCTEPDARRALRLVSEKSGYSAWRIEADTWLNRSTRPASTPPSRAAGSALAGRLPPGRLL